MTSSETGRLLLERLRILVVEADPVLGPRLSNLLASEDGDVRLATTASDALRIADAFVPELVLLDISLPDGNGLELCARWRHLIPSIVIISARSRPEDVVRGKAAGAADCVAEPFSLDDLLKRVWAVRGDAMGLSRETAAFVPVSARELRSRHHDVRSRDVNRQHQCEPTGGSQ